MGPTLRFKQYQLDLEQLYSKMWAIAVDDLGDDTRLFRPRPGEREALKWLIEDLSGALADPVRPTRSNNALRQQAHESLTGLGWAERINQVSFRLLRPPEPNGTPHQSQARRVGISEDPVASASLLDEQSTDGLAIVDVPVETVTADGGILNLADLSWSLWETIDVAAQKATTHPGVYVARSDGQIVYVGMAGERRGQGVRGRIRTYARGRGAVSGLGEAVLDRALADPAWLAQRLANLYVDGPARAKDWARAAIQRSQLEVCWVAAPDAETAREWELQVLRQLEDVALWNRARPKPGGPSTT